MPARTHGLISTLLAAAVCVATSPGCGFGTDCAAIACDSSLTIEVLDLTDATEFDLRLDIDGESFIAQCMGNQSCLLGNPGEAEVEFTRDGVSTFVRVIGQPNEVAIEITVGGQESAQVLMPDWGPPGECGACEEIEVETTFAEHVL